MRQLGSSIARVIARAITATVVVTVAILGTVSVARAVLAPNAASQLVTVLGNGTECGPGSPSKLVDQRQNSDGTSSPFIVPAKSVFVITGYDFLFSGGTASQHVNAPLIVVDAGLTHVSYVGTPSALADSTGSGSGALLLPSGFPMKAGTRLCFQYPPGVSGVVFVRGFFAKDK